MTNKILTRIEIPKEQTWDLDCLFTDFEKWNKTYRELPTSEEVKAHLESHFVGKLATTTPAAPGPKRIFDLLTYRDALSRRLVNLYVYAHLRNSEDVGSSESVVNLSKVSNLYSALMSHFAFIEPELLTIKELEKWKEQEPLTAYAYEMTELLRGKKHVLSDKEETLMARLSPVLGKNSDIFSKWNNVDLTFEDVLDGKGESHPLSHSRYGSSLISPDRTLRENTFRSYYATVSKWRNTIAENFYARLLTGSTLAKVRGFDGFLQSQLFQDDIPTTLYDKLIDSVTENLPILGRSMLLRKKVLGLDSVHHFDRYVSLSRGKPRTFSWEEGCALVLASIEPMGAEYVELARAGLGAQRWVDFAENKGKRSGAFSSGTFDSKPYILMSWIGTLSDVYTLAHELGHSMHTLLANRSQPYHLSRYTIFVAEVASTLNESLLTEYILNKHGDSGLSEEVVSYWLKGFESTVYRQVLFGAFERDVSKMVDEDHPLTADIIDKVYEDLNVKFYSANGTIDPEVKHEWMRIPHFYSTFYVYKYATSYCASLSLLEALQKNAKAGQEQVMTLLQTGGSKSPLDTMKAAGVDFLTGKVFTDAFSVYDQNVKRAEKLFLQP